MSLLLSLNLVQLFATPWTAECQASLSFTISLSLLKFMSTESMMPSSHLILHCRLLLLPSVFPSIRVFSVADPKDTETSDLPDKEYKIAVLRKLKEPQENTEKFAIRKTPKNKIRNLTKR